MNSLIVDNWTLETICYDMLDVSSEDPSYEYQQLIMAILLWDDLCFWDSPFSAHWKESGLLPNSLFRPIHYDAHKNTYADTVYRKHFSNNYSEIVAKGAIEYIQICEENACDYLPSSSRNTFLKNNYESLGRNQLSRLSVLSPLDNALQEEYDQIVKAYNMNPLIIEFPVLIDYIMDQAEKEGMSYWEMALHIREWGPVISFRKLIETIEGEMGDNNWNVKELDRLRKHSQQLVDDITKKAGCDLSISLTDVKPYLSPSITADIVKFDTRYMFLTDLAKYGMSNQRMKRIMKRERKRIK